MSRRSASSENVRRQMTESTDAPVDVQFDCAVKVIRGLPKEGMKVRFLTTSLLKNSPLTWTKAMEMKNFFSTRRKE